MGSILSKAEIDALLQTSGSQPTYENLVRILAEVAKRAVSTTGVMLSQPVEIDGPFAEGITGSLGQLIADDVYILAADVGKSELFFLMPANDSTVLGDKLKQAPQNAVQELAKIWIESLARNLGVQARIFRVRSIKAEALAELPLAEDSVLVRHLLRTGESGMEVCLLFQGEQWQELVELRLDTKEDSRLLRGGRSPVSEAEFSPLDLPDQTPSSHQLALVEDIQLSVTVEIGQVKLTLNDVLELKPQSVIPLDRHVGEAVDIYINNRQSAKGEVVVLDEHFGVRILEILPKSERIATD